LQTGNLPLSVVFQAFALHCVNYAFAHHPGKPCADDAKGVPQAAHENNVAAVPKPFKNKWEHIVFPLFYLQHMSVR
jgi:hypothetical protein